MVVLLPVLRVELLIIRIHGRRVELQMLRLVIFLSEHILLRLLTVNYVL